MVLSFNGGRHLNLSQCRWEGGSEEGEKQTHRREGRRPEAGGRRQEAGKVRAPGLGAAVGLEDPARRGSGAGNGGVGSPVAPPCPA